MNRRSYRAAYYQGLMQKGAGYLRTNPYKEGTINSDYWYAGYDGLHLEQFHAAMLIKRKGGERKLHGPLHDQG